MRILAIGDIVGKPGREYVYQNLGRIRSKYNIDFVIANGENSAATNGITPIIADELVNADHAAAVYVNIVKVLYA